MRDGFKLYLDEVKNRAAGREIVFFNEDTEAKPEWPHKARKLVEKDGVNPCRIVHSGWLTRPGLRDRKEGSPGHL